MCLDVYKQKTTHFISPGYRGVSRGNTVHGKRWNCAPVETHNTQHFYYYYLREEDYDNSKILLLFKSRRISFLFHKTKVQTVKNVNRVAYVKNKLIEWRPLHVAPRAPALPKYATAQVESNLKKNKKKKRRRMMMRRKQTKHSRILLTFMWDNI